MTGSYAVKFALKEGQGKADTKELLNCYRPTLREADEVAANTDLIFDQSSLDQDIRMK